MSETFDQAAYWRERHQKLRGDHRATGNISRSPEQMLQRKLVQAYFFSTLVNALLSAARDPRSWLAKPDAPGGRRDVLDIGFGTGFLGSLLTQQGIPYTGCDLSEVAVEDAAAMCPEARYMLHDIVQQPAQESFVVIASEVLFHIVDDAQWMDALGNIAAGLRRDSVFFFTETFVAQIQSGPSHFKPRTRKMYVEALARHGLRFVRPDELRFAARPVFNQYTGFHSLHFVRRAESPDERTAYFHAGTHKTGTTSIQEFMRLNKGYLRKHGIVRVVDDVLLTNSGQQRAAHRVAEALAQGSKSENWKVVKEAIPAMPADMPLFLSSEQIFRHLTAAKSDAIRAAIIENIKTVLGEKVAFILYVRNFGEYVNSLVAERIVATADARPLRDIARSLRHLAGIQSVVEQLQAAFGPGSVRAHSFDAAVKAPGGLLSHFVQGFGHGRRDDMVRPKGSLHSMPPAHVLALKYRMNGLDLDKSLYPLLRRQIPRITQLHPRGDAFRIVDDETIDEVIAEGRRRNPGLVGLFPDDLSEEVLFTDRAKARPYVDIAQMDIAQMDIAQMDIAGIEEMFLGLAESTKPPS